MNKPGRRGGPRETASESSAPGGMPSDFSREHFKALIESSDDAIISKDMAGNVTS